MEYVYHYTSADGLKGILESKSLWATNAEYLNDFREIKQGIDRIKSLRGSLSEFSQIKLEEIYAKHKNIPLDVTQKEMRSKDVHLANHFLNFLWNIIDNNTIDEIYTTSFTTKRDSLNHWLTYGSEQTSYCIKFNKEKLFDDEYFRQRKLLSGYDDVDYQPTEEMLHSLIEEHYLPEVLSYVLDPNLNGNDLNEKCAIAAIEIFNEAIFKIASIKDQAFEYEEEYRFTLFYPGLVSLNENTEKGYFDFIDSSNIDFIELENGVKEFFPLCYRTLKSGIIAPYRAIPFPKNSIDEIIIGPSENNELAVKGLKSFLSSLNFDVEVSSTKTSFRRI
ncbi:MULTISPECIES: DUF2971 domain-containing protein [Pseudoalteromonas]|jgi:hypothetical protein|uniref:DUF2971 domain-containing protein n=1 Tax=Pseudoalteromonas TaxID=53246 RepID=UPI00040AD23D|nr:MULTISPECIES: DUF2971 domain-containing protein [Pseudoalteromonas]MBA6409244.1 DUF2971 domain-containing protein [Pseudoalteromonas sp. 5Ae-yellow]MBB1281568.1 DUF2971 domain-containing protein [Pseudoalteromonas sp. SR41-1]MBB1298597.1 DUF2971 domain-containing protein [Pseudoalteromonas sp. SR41-7]MBB1351286.1 DUF2971 domain-containing protein [Pseudoalteromonas sp. SG45-3]MBB1358326.1 DUF2971 domain-containing protein [Pseudoalteromonas sp. SG45-6]|tara:strand:+ start:1512 stop:2510 length:999 start_codon:yes stop_codon:yes gene_type:complete